MKKNYLATVLFMVTISLGVAAKAGIENGDYACYREEAASISWWFEICGSIENPNPPPPDKSNKSLMRIKKITGSDTGKLKSQNPWVKIDGKEWFSNKDLRQPHFEERSRSEGQRWSYQMNRYCAKSGDATVCEVICVNNKGQERILSRVPAYETKEGYWSGATKGGFRSKIDVFVDICLKQ